MGGCGWGLALQGDGPGEEAGIQEKAVSSGNDWRSTCQPSAACSVAFSDFALTLKVSTRACALGNPAHWGILRTE